MHDNQNQNMGGWMGHTIKYLFIDKLLDDRSVRNKAYKLAYSFAVLLCQGQESHDIHECTLCKNEAEPNTDTKLALT